MGSGSSFDIQTANLDRDTQTEMYKSCNWQSWAIVYMRNDSETYHNFSEELRDVIGRLNISAQKPAAIQID